jgi:CHASE2 domain-containing sensor protein/signal transduction histidine kinase
MSFHRWTMRLRALAAPLVALIVFPALLVWLAQRPGLEQLDMHFYDRALPLAAQSPSPEILIVAIDEPSLAALGKWPWPRETHAKLLDRLADAGARSVMLDLLLMEPSEDAAQDERLAQAMEQLPVYLPLQANRAPSIPRVAPDEFLTPLPMFQKRAAGVGHAELVLDADGIARSLFMRLGPPDNARPYIGLLMAGRVPPSLQSRGITDAAGWRYADRLLIPYAGPRGSYRTVPYVSVLHGELPQEFLRDRIVLVGSTTPGLGDQVVAPLSGHAQLLAGVEVHANAIDQLMHRRSIRVPGWLESYLWIGLPLWLAAWLFWRFEGAGLTRLAGVALGTVLVSLAALYWLRWWLAPATPVVGLLALYLIWNWGRQRSQLRYLQQRAELLQALPAGAFELPPADWRQPRHALPSNRVLDRAISRMVGLQVLAESTIQAMPVGVLLCDAQGLVVGSNAAARELLSVASCPEAAARQLQHLPDLLRSMRPQSKTLAQTDGAPPAWIGQVHSEYTTKDERHFQLLIAPVIPGAAPAPSGYIVALADLTSERRVQQQRELWNRFLSHDLRNPQASILALIDLEELDAGASPLSSAIRREALRTLQLAEEFLDVSHAWTGNYRFAPAHLGALLFDVRDQVCAYAARKQVELVLRMADEDEEIELNVDAALLTRAVVNLLNNAIRHSPSGSVVQLCLGADEREVAIAVIDEGTGMSEAALQQLLSGINEASVGQPSGEQGVRSHGLGFEFVRTVVARHGGTIDGTAAPEAGSTFWMLLPRQA